MFTHLHLHTLYSLLDANIKLDDLMKKLKNMGQTSVAITDHGVMYGVVDFYKTAKEYGIKPIIGCECYICEEDASILSMSNSMYHVVLLAKNETGRQNLQRLVTESTMYKFNKRFRIDFSMLQKYSEGLVCLSACMAGQVSKALMNGEFEKSINIAKKYQDIFKDDYYIEFQAHTSTEQQALNKKLIKVAQIISAKYVVTCDSHYLNKEDQKYHSMFVKIGSTREAGEIYDDCYVQSEEEVFQNCIGIDENVIRTAIKNTQEIANKCNVEYPLSAPIIPHIKIPQQYKSEEDYLKALCNQGFKDKGFLTWNMEQWKDYMTETIYNADGTVEVREFVHFDTVEEIVKIYKDRAKYEMDSVLKMGFEGYYLLVHSYISSARRRGIARGSAGGSLLAYLCGIVDIDPIKYSLYFERFIDVGAIDLLDTGQITRKELKIPDVDADFSPTDRDKVMQYIIESHGKENVVCLGVFQYIWAKGAIKDIGRALGIPFETTNEITKLLNNETIDEALELGIFDDYKDKYPELFEYASKLSGLPKSYGMHACGKICTMREAVYYNALEHVPDGDLWVLQGNMHTADDLGLVKIDLLGLRTLDVIYDVLDMIGEDYDLIAPHKINLSDRNVWKEFMNGNSLLIFQFESQGMRNMLKEMGCNSIDDLSAANALYRPGSKGYIPNYIARKNGTEPITYINNDLEPILSTTYGIIVYQEQLIEIGKLAGLRNPDELRKATAKKKPKLMAKIEPELKNGLIERNWTQDQVDKLWTDILDFAKYSFNKSHSQAYALTAYITMYLKVYHPVEFITAYINSYEGKTNEIAEVLYEAKRLGVKYRFDYWKNIQGTTTCRDGIVYLGINVLKGFGSDVAVGINEIGNKDIHTFVDLIEEFYSNEHVDKSQFAAMIKLGMFDEYGKVVKLLKILKQYNNVYKAKIFYKNKLPEDISEELIKKYSRETKKQYRDIDNKGLFKELCSVIPDKDISLKNRLKVDLEYKGIIDYCNPKYSDIAFVIDMNTKYSPKVKLYFIGDGHIEVYKISKKIFVNNPLNIHDMIRIIETKEKYKMEKIGEEFVVNKNAYDVWLDRYSII